LGGAGSWNGGFLGVCGRSKQAGSSARVSRNTPSAIPTNAFRANNTFDGLGRCPDPPCNVQSDPVRLAPTPPPFRGVEVTTLVPYGPLPITRITRAVPIAPADRDGYFCRLLPHPTRAFPVIPGSASSSPTSPVRPSPGCRRTARGTRASGTVPVKRLWLVPVPPTVSDHRFFYESPGDESQCSCQHESTSYGCCVYKIRMGT
jgi:hypothetical protein